MAEPIRIIETICWFPPKDYVVPEEVEPQKPKAQPRQYSDGMSKNGKKLGRPRKNAKDRDAILSKVKKRDAKQG